MPAAEAAKIPDADNAWLTCACGRDLPVDDAHGPYPVVLFLHGAASFRAQSASLVAHFHTPRAPAGPRASASPHPG